jgi:hypothetical protein
MTADRTALLTPATIVALLNSTPADEPPAGCVLGSE